MHDASAPVAEAMEERTEEATNVAEHLSRSEMLSTLVHAATESSSLATGVEMLSTLPAVNESGSSAEHEVIRREVLSSGPTHMENFFTVLKERGLADDLIFDDESDDPDMIPPPGFVTHVMSDPPPSDDAFHRWRQVRAERSARVRRLRSPERERSTCPEPVTAQDQEGDAPRPQSAVIKRAGSDHMDSRPQGAPPPPQSKPTRANCMDFDAMGFPPSGPPRARPERASSTDFEKTGLPHAGTPHARLLRASSTDFEKTGLPHAGAPRPKQMTRVDCVDFDKIMPLAGRTDLASDDEEPRGGVGAASSNGATGVRCLPPGLRELLGQRPEGGRSGLEKTGNATANQPAHATGKQRRPAYGRTLRPAADVDLGKMEIVRPDSGTSSHFSNTRGQQRSPSPEQTPLHQERTDPDNARLGTTARQQTPATEWVPQRRECMDFDKMGFRGPNFGSVDSHLGDTGHSSGPRGHRTGLPSGIGKQARPSSNIGSLISDHSKASAVLPAVRGHPASLGA